MDLPTSTHDSSENGSGTDEDESDVVWTTNDEKNFLKTFSALKSHDPKIYNTNNDAFFSDNESPGLVQKKKIIKAPNKRRLTLRDYELSIAGKSFDDEETVTSSYVEQEGKIKNEFKNLLSKMQNEINDEDLLVRKVKTGNEQKKEENDYYQWLKNDGSMRVLDEDLNRLKKRWSRTNALDSDEVFLRDYLLQRKFDVDEDNTEDHIPSYDEITNEEEDTKITENFEHKYNFRFEDPDQEFIKRYPRTITEALRKSGSRRKSKRDKIKESKKIEDSKEVDDDSFKFRYRTVVPNSYGLTTGEILTTDDSFLNKWVPINRVSMYRTDEEEQRDIYYFHRKAQKKDKKKQILQPILSSTSTTEMEKNGKNIKQKMEGITDTAKNGIEKDNKNGNEDLVGASSSFNHDSDLLKHPKCSRTNGNNSTYRKDKTDTSMHQIPLENNRFNIPQDRPKNRKKCISLIENLDTNRLRSYGVNTKKLKRLKYNKGSDQQNVISSGNKFVN